MQPGRLDQRITVLVGQTYVDPVYGADVVQWVEFATIWANVQDMLPSRAERVAEGINLSRRPARIRIRFLSGLSSAMRVQIGVRLLQIVTEPAEIGRRAYMEFMAEEVSTMGDAP